MSSKSLKRTAEIVVLCVCAAVVWGCESDAQKYAGELKIRHAICMNKAGTFNASASVQCLCENTPDLRLSSAYVCSEGVRVSCDSAPQFCESNGAGEIGRLTYCSAGVWKTGYCECNANQNGCRECDETKDLPVCYSNNGQIVSRYCDNGEFKFDVCTKGCNVNGECNQECDPVNAVTFCYDSDSTHEVRKCENGVFKTMKTCDLGCANGKCNAECNTGEEKCENFTHYTCNDGMWERKAYCPLGCDGKTCRNAACTDNVCIMPENTVGYLFECKEGKISENRTKVCENDASCSSSNTCGECKNGEKKCVNGYTSVCVHGQLIPNKDEICDGRVCDDGVLYCSDNVLKECVDGKWKNTDCSLDGAFCDATSKQCKKIECNLEDVKCAGEKSINKCGDDGQWNTTSCNNDDVCVHTDNGDECTECIPNTASCDGNTLKSCNPEGKLSVESCPSEKPFCVNKKCVECEVNDEKCEGNIHKQCENGKWKTELCANGCDNNKCASQCVEHCDDNTPHVCSNNQAQKKCDEGKTCRVIDHKAICTECDPDDPNARSRCYPSNTGFDTSVGQYQVCENGMWSTPKTCTVDTRICAELGCGSAQQCEAEKTKCERGDFKVCRENQWITYQTCEYGCDDESGCYECREGQSRCDGNTIQKCNGGFWDSTNSNKSNVNCEENGLICVEISDGSVDCKKCKPNAAECDFSNVSDDIGRYKMCNNNYMWDEPQNCSSDVPVCTDNAQCACQMGDTLCVNDSLGVGTTFTCGGDVSGIPPCEGQVSCNGNACGNCRNGSKQCDGNVFKTCEKGQWETTTTCGAGEVCDDNEGCVTSLNDCSTKICSVPTPVCAMIGNEPKCVECHPNTNECLENKESRTCNRDGKWENPVDCPNGCDPSTGECMDGPNRCDATKLTISADGFKYDGNLISDWSLECDNTKGLLIKDLGVCSTSIILATGGDCSKLPYKGYVGLDKMEGQKPVTLCKDTTLQMESGESNQGSYKLQFTIGKSLATLNVSVCSSGCVGNVCSNMQNGKQCRCNSETINSFTTCCSSGSPYMCLGGDLIDCSGTSLCASTCNEKCSETSNTTITISEQLVTVCDNGVNKTYYMFSYACDDTDAIKKLNLYSGATGPTLALTPYGTSTLDCNSLLNKDFDYPQGPTGNTIISGSGTLCAVDANSASGGKFAFVFDDHEDPKSVHADKGVCNVCVDNAVCSTHSDCNGGVCMPGKIGGRGKCICESKPVQCPTGTGPRKCFDIDDNGDICYGTCEGTSCVCEATMQFSSRGIAFSRVHWM